MKEEYGICGNLKTHRITDILLPLIETKKTGILVLQNGKYKKKLYLGNGEIVFASTNEAKEQLENRLLRQGIITDEQHQAYTQLLEENKERACSYNLLVKVGLLTPKELYTAVQLQIKDIIYSMFNMNSGLYYFKEKETVHQKGIILLKIDTAAIIYEGLKRIKNWAIIYSEIGDFTIFFRVAPEVPSIFRNIKLSSIEQGLLKLVLEKKEVREIIDNASADSYSSMKSLYVLYAMGFIEKENPDSQNHPAFNSSLLIQ